MDEVNFPLCLPLFDEKCTYCGQMSPWVIGQQRTCLQLWYHATVHGNSDLSTLQSGCPRWPVWEHSQQMPLQLLNLPSTATATLQRNLRLQWLYTWSCTGMEFYGKIRDRWWSSWQWPTNSSHCLSFEPLDEKDEGLWDIWVDEVARQCMGCCGWY